jgi:hypothetical protein
MDALKRDVAEAAITGHDDEEAWAKAQEVISLRRASQTRR